MSETEIFKIKTEEFEGPLDLLLHLIEKRKLLINDISLAKITDDYLNYIKVNQLPMEQNSHFILVASTLLLIKSKSLLPTLDLTEEESQSIDDLEKRLKVRKRLKDTEPVIEEMFGKNRSFSRKQVTNRRDVVFAPSGQINIGDIKESIAGLIKALPKLEKVPQAIVQKVISLEEVIGNLTERVTKSINMSFKEFSGLGKAEKTNVIVSFLAMLELVKEGIIETTQQAHYADIDIQTKNFDTPNYS